MLLFFFFFKQKTAYEMRISDWSSDVCSSDFLTAFLPRMIAQAGEAHIVNTGSIAGFVALPERGVYAATKYAAVAISVKLRTELAPHALGVTVICAGSVRTRILGASRNRPTELQAQNVSPPDRTRTRQNS